MEPRIISVINSTEIVPLMWPGSIMTGGFVDHGLESGAEGPAQCHPNINEHILLNPHAGLFSAGPSFRRNGNRSS